MAEATVFRIAGALDPGFAGRCQVEQRPLTDDEFAALRLARQPPPLERPTGPSQRVAFASPPVLRSLGVL